MLYFAWCLVDDDDDQDDEDDDEIDLEAAEKQILDSFKSILSFFGIADVTKKVK